MTLSPSQPYDHTFANLDAVSKSHGVTGTGGALAVLLESVRTDLAYIPSAIECVCNAASLVRPAPGAAAGDGLDPRETPVRQSVRHLLLRPGKRLRPLCVALAAKVGGDFGPAAQKFALAIELVHAATLLHDDVVDVGDLRRGVPTARVVYGNAASIYGGDWLLVEALRLIQSAKVPGVLERMLTVLSEMLDAESLQLANRGVVDVSLASYLRVVQGKTASLFRWALFAGGRAAELPEETCLALERYGDRVGVAFQIIDDVLDLYGDASQASKSLFRDLSEGKMTYPLLCAIDKDPTLAPVIRHVSGLDAGQDDALLADVARRVRETGAFERSLAFARSLAAEAIAELERVPACTAREALASFALETVERTA